MATIAPDGPSLSSPAAEAAVDSVEAWLWAPLVVIMAVAAAAFAATDLHLDPRLLSNLPQCFCAITAALLLQRMKVAAWLWRFTFYTNYLLLLGLAGMTATYAAATLGRPFADTALLAADQALGYSWRGYAEFYVAHRWAAWLILPCYHLIYSGPTVAIAGLVITRRYGHAERLLLAMSVATAFTIAVFALFPARTAWGASGVPLDQVHALRYLPSPNEGWEHDLMQLRAGMMHSIGRGSGLIAFPSLHCVMALLSGWAAWPLRRIRWPMLALTVATILSTPIMGGHYLIDMVGGAAVTALGIFAAPMLHRLLRQAVRRADRPAALETSYRPKVLAPEG